MSAQVVHVVGEVAARRLACDAPSLKRALQLLLEQVPPMVVDGVKVVGLLAEVCQSGGKENGRIRGQLPDLAHTTVRGEGG